MNSFGKSLTVAAALGSLAFMAFSMSLALGGPNWRSELESPALTEDFTIKVDPATPGTKTTYTLAVRRPEGGVATTFQPSSILPKVIIDGKQWKAKNLAEKLKMSTDLATQQEANIAARKAEIEKDRQSFEARQKVLRDFIAKLDKQIADLSSEHRQVILENETVIKEVRERVTESYRLQNQIELLRDDAYAAREQLLSLQDELTQLTALAERLALRNDQLKKMAN